MRKKLISLLMTAAMIMTLLPITVSAQANINIGEYVRMGTYYGEPILWRCVDIDENGPLMLSDKIICIKPFDAAGDNKRGSHGRGYNDGQYRKQSGSNYWADSNMRCWLNSDASAGNVNWVCGNPPTEDKVWDGYNEYADEAGFLTNFTAGERNAIKTVTQKSLLDGYDHDSNDNNENYHRYNLSIYDVLQNYDSAYSETAEDSVFLLDVKQIKAVYDNTDVLGDGYYIGEPTSQCVENSEYKNSELAVGKKWYSWLRSPDAYNGSGNVVRDVNSGGNVSGSYVDTSYVGVRPAFYLNLSSSSFTSGSGTAAAPYTVEGSGSYTPATETPVSNASILFTSLYINGARVGQNYLVTVNVYDSDYDTVSVSVSNPDIAEPDKYEIELKDTTNLRGEPYKMGDVNIYGKAEGTVVLTAVLPDGTSKSMDIYVQPGELGFDTKINGWAFKNDADYFGYPEGYVYPAARYKEIFGNWIAPLYEKWWNRTFAGNCYGMSTYAMMIYNGYESIENTANNAGSLKNIAGENVILAPEFITKKIEQYHLSQYSKEKSENSGEEISDNLSNNKKIFNEVVDNMYKSNKTYSLGMHAPYVKDDGSIGDAGHRVVIDSSRGAEDRGNGIYYLYFYDPNNPYYENSSILRDMGEYMLYGMRFLEINTKTGEWSVNILPGVKAGSDIEDSYIQFEDMEWQKNYLGTGYSIEYNWLAWLKGEDITITNNSGKTILEITDGSVVTHSNDIEIVTFEDGTASDEFFGQVKFNDSSIGTVSMNDAAFTMLNNAKAMQIASENETEFTVDESTVNITAESDGEISIVAENINGRDNYDAVEVKGDIDKGESVTVTNRGTQDYEMNTTSDNDFTVTVMTEQGENTIENVNINNWSKSEPDENEAKTSFGSVVSDWAAEEIEEAYDANLIPEVLVGEDLTKKVDRAEFASIAVKLYEELSGKKAENGYNPFKDISANKLKEDIIKAYSLGITNGITDVTFEPSTLISREQVATMLTRAYKKSEFSGWTLAKDSDYPLNYMGVTKYADDDEISDYAKESVYFMTRWEILKGVDESHFAPKNNATLGEAYGYATREQAVVIALRSAKHL